MSGNDAWYRDIRSHLSRNPPSSLWTSTNEQSLLEPYTYLASRPGKEIRSKLIDAFNIWLQVPDLHLNSVRKVVDMLHTASLLMDDVEDNSDLRRGLPVAHKVYGTPQVLNTANYVYFLVFRQVEIMSEQEPPCSSSTKAMLSERLLVEEMINLHRGQGLDLLWRDTLTCPTEQEYVEMVRNKTGGLLRIAGGLMKIWSPIPTQQESLLTLLDLIGLLFQIRDDYLNLSADSYAKNKGFAEDLTEGKFSFPMIHGIRTSTANSAPEETQTPVPSSSSSSTATSTSASTSIGLSTGPSRHSLSTSIGLSTGPSRQTSMPSSSTGESTYQGLGSIHPPLHLHSPASHSPLSSPSLQRLPLHNTPPQANRQLLSILSSRPTDENIKRYAIDYLKHTTKSFEYCRKVMKEIDSQIWIELQQVESTFNQGQQNEPLRKILVALREGWWEHQD
ncbi:unnamed protein product [Sympodiomycopsis kandeliae]